MGLAGATADTYRLQAPTGAEWTSDAFTTCGWVTVGTANTSRDAFFSNFKSIVGGLLFRGRFNAGLLEFTYGDGTLNVTQLHGHANYVAGKRLFVFGSADASGNGDLGHVFEGVLASTSTSGAAPSNAFSSEPPTLMGHTTGLSNQKLLGVLEDLRIFNTRLTLAEILSIEASDGRVNPQPHALISHLQLNDDIPGVDTDTTVPLDIADPDRAWSVAGAGNASTWSASLAPLRRRPS